MEENYEKLEERQENLYLLQDKIGWLATIIS